MFSDSVPRITRPLDDAIFHISTGSIELHPRFGNMLGGTPVLIDPGVPFAGNEEIDCDFDGIKTTGVHINSNLALCVSPTLPDFSSIPFELTISGRAPQQTEFLSGTLYVALILSAGIHTGGGGGGGGGDGDFPPFRKFPPPFKSAQVL